MKHINFIERKQAFGGFRINLKLDFLWLVFIATGVFLLGLTIHLVLSSRISSYQGQFVALRQMNQKPAPAVITVKPIEGIVWSDWLRKYSAEFPRYIHMKKISGNTKKTAKILLEATGQTTLDASRMKRNLIKTGLCKEVELSSVNQTEEGVTFELECKL